ncbi:MAG: hypothetical protein KF821_01835 [Anaerolineales bacterium]|nr:hypothetical protein [Anaerolineales bacterium]
MAKQYERTDWVDDLLVGDPRYNISDGEGEPIYEDVQISLASLVAHAGTPVNAEHMNNLEDGVDMLDTIVNEDGVRRLQVDGESDPVTLEIGEVQDGQALVRQGDTIVGGSGGASLAHIWVAG